MKTMMHRAVVGACVLGALLGLGERAPAFVDLQGRSSARLIKGGNTTFLENDPGVDPFFPNDTTGFVTAQNFHLLGSGIAQSALSTSGLGAGAASNGVSLSPVDNLLYQASGFGNVRYRDELTVTSATLPTGTPVQVMFSFHLSHTIFADCSIGNGGGDTRRGRADGDLAVGLTSSDFASGTIDTAFLLSGDHNAITDTGFSINQAKGIFASGHVDLFLDATIGAKIDVSITLDASSTINVVQSGGTNVTGQGYIAMGLAFGATGVSLPRAGDITVVSSFLGGVFPDASTATEANANLAMPFVPAPPIASFVGVFLVGPLSRRGRRATAAVG